MDNEQVKKRENLKEKLPDQGWIALNMRNSLSGIIGKRLEVKEAEDELKDKSDQNATQEEIKELEERLRKFQEELVDSELRKGKLDELWEILRETDKSQLMLEQKAGDEDELIREINNAKDRIRTILADLGEKNNFTVVNVEKIVVPEPVPAQPAPAAVSPAEPAPASAGPQAPSAQPAQQLAPAPELTPEVSPTSPKEKLKFGDFNRETDGFTQFDQLEAYLREKIQNGPVMLGKTEINEAFVDNLREVYEGKKDLDSIENKTIKDKVQKFKEEKESKEKSEKEAELKARSEEFFQGLEEVANDKDKLIAFVQRFEGKEVRIPNTDKVFVVSLAQVEDYVKNLKGTETAARVVSQPQPQPERPKAVAQEDPKPVTEQPKPAEQVNQARKEAKEREEILKDLEAKVRNARLRYVEADARNRDSRSLIKKVLGINPKPEDSVNNALNNYQNALAELRNFHLERLRENSTKMTTMQMAERGEELSKYFDNIQRIELETDLRAVQKFASEQRDSNIFRRAGEKILNWYRNIPRKYQLLTGAILLGGGALAFVSGASAVAAGLAGLGFARRVMGSAALGVGAKEYMEKSVSVFAEGKMDAIRGDRRKQVEKAGRREEFLGPENPNEKASFRAVSEWLSQDIANTEKNLKGIHSRNTWSKRIGAGVALAGLGFASLQYWNQLHSGGAGTTIRKPSGGGVIPENSTGGVSRQPEINTAEAVPQRPPAGQAEAQGPRVENGTGGYHAGSNIGKAIEIPKGGSIEGGIIKQLTENGISPEEAGRKAHKMVLDYADEKKINPKELDYVLPGEKFVINPDGSKIIDLKETVESHYLRSVRSISENNPSAWRKIKDIAFENVDQRTKVGKKLASRMLEYKALMGDQANPKPGETAFKWLARMSQIKISKN